MSDTPPVFAALGAEFLSNPYPMYAMLRANDPATYAPGIFGLGAWLFSTHALCSSALRSKHFIKEGRTLLPPERMVLIPQDSADPAERRRSSMLFRDPPHHTRLRGLVSNAFTPRIIEQLRPHITEIAEHLLDAAAA